MIFLAFFAQVVGQVHCCVCVAVVIVIPMWAGEGGNRRGSFFPGGLLDEVEVDAVHASGGWFAALAPPECLVGKVLGVVSMCFIVLSILWVVLGGFVAFVGKIICVVCFVWEYGFVCSGGYFAFP